MKWIKRIAYTFGVIYVVLCFALFFQQEALLFHPRQHSAGHQYGNYPEAWIDLPDGNRLHALHLREGGKAEGHEGVIMYLHGNVGDNGRSLYHTKAIRDLGYDLFLVDYRGFGKSEGAITSEADMTEDFQAAYDYLLQTYTEDQIILAGYSLGSGPVSYLAAHNSPRSVVLVAPYTSLTDMKNEFFWMFPDFLMKYELNNRKHLAASTSPVYILHGNEDELIPLDMGKELASLDPDRIRLVELDGTSHRGAILHRRFGQVVRWAINDANISLDKGMLK